MSETALEKRDDTPFMLFDKLDDDIIKAELEGKLPTVLTYHFTQDGKEVWGISKAGVDEAVREMSKRGEVIREMSLDFTETDTDYLFKGVCGRYAVSNDGREVQLDTRVGLKRQPKYYHTGKPNPFAYEQGGMKALRNANRRLIPEEVIQGVIEYAKKAGKVKEVKPEKAPSAPSQPSPAPKTTLVEIQDVIRDIAKGRQVTPAEVVKELGYETTAKIPHNKYDEIRGKLTDMLNDLIKTELDAEEI